MDLSYLPNIFSLTIFIVGFRPLVRKLGSHVNLWFLGWGLILLHYVALLLAQPSGKLHLITAFAAYWAEDLCALTFMLAAAAIKGYPLATRFIGVLAIPVLAQSALCLAGSTASWLLLGVLCLFVLPLCSVLLAPRPRSKSFLLLGIAFALFAVAMVPLAEHSASLVGDGVLCMLFLSAAYLYLGSTARKGRGAVAAIAGLIGWGLSFPIVDFLQHIDPGVILNRTLVEAPQYLVIAGIILILIEEYVVRTERLAMHDPLTDLPNRRLFEERLIATMEEARIHRTTVACLVIDVDNFKHINDTLGHSTGDALLRALAVRLSWHMSPRDILARTGGDEFTALLAGVTDEHHLRFIAGAMMSAASVPIMVDGKPVDVRISVGIALSPDDADDIDSLRRAADEAMYSAKRRGGSLLAFAGEK